MPDAETTPTPVAKGGSRAPMSVGKKGAIAPMQEIGGTGLRSYGGRIYEEFLTELAGYAGVRVYREMRENDPIIGGILFALKMLIRQVDWRVEPASESAQDKEAADFLESCLHDMSQTWEDTLSEILSFIHFGWSYHEIVYKKRVGPTEADPAKRSRHKDGRIGWRKLPIRAQETLLRWEIDEMGDGSIQGLTQQIPPSYRQATVPIEKALLFRSELNKGSPEGRSVLRNAYRPWYFKKKIEEIEAIGVERDLAGLPQLIAAEGVDLFNSDDPDMVALKAVCDDLVQNIRRDQAEGVVLPFGWQFTLTSSAGKRQMDTDAIIQRYDQRIALTVLGDFILIGHEKNGSRAVSDSKIGLFAQAISAWLDMIADVINRHAVPRLFALNPDLPQDELPTLKPGEVEEVDLVALGDFIQKTVGAGVVIPDGELERYVRTAAHLPEPKEDDPMRQATIDQQTLAAQQQAQALEQGDVSMQQAKEDIKATQVGTQHTAAQIDHTRAQTKTTLNPPKPPQAAAQGKGPVKKDAQEIAFSDLPSDVQETLAKGLGIVLVDMGWEPEA